MKLELQADLLRRYPNFFRKLGEGRLLTEIAPFDERGIECGDGWFALIERLSTACESEIDALISQGVTEVNWPRAAQIKEKMGGLRFYVNGSITDALRALILTAEEEESRHICECCGAPGKLREGRWRHTYCDQHAEQSVTR